MARTRPATATTKKPSHLLKARKRNVRDAHGASAERLVRDRLDRLTDEGLMVFHDMIAEGATHPIDHVVVAPAGVHVIDTKLHMGRVELVNKGEIFHPDLRLQVGSRDRTSLVHDLQQQVVAVNKVFFDSFLPTPITPVLCLVDAEWRMFSHELELEGVRIVWPDALVKILYRPGILADMEMKTAATIIGRRLRPSRV